MGLYSQGQRARRIEMLLGHEFYDRKFLLPDRLTAKQREQQARNNGEEAAETTATGEQTAQEPVVPWAGFPKTTCCSQMRLHVSMLWCG